MDFDGERPIFLQLADQLKDAIIAGVYQGDQQVPSITEYAVACKINPATALKGVNLLIDAGLLYKRRGVGVFVSPAARQTLLEERRGAFLEQRLLPLVQEARQLGLSCQEVQNMIERGFANEHPTGTHQ